MTTGPGGFGASAWPPRTPPEESPCPRPGPPHLGLPSLQLCLLQTTLQRRHGFLQFCQLGFQQLLLSFPLAFLFGKRGGGRARSRVKEEKDIEADGGGGTESKGKKGRKERITSSLTATSPISQLFRVCLGPCGSHARIRSCRPVPALA